MLYSVYCRKCENVACFTTVPPLVKIVAECSWCAAKRKHQEKQQRELRAVSRCSGRGVPFPARDG